MTGSSIAILPGNERFVCTFAAALTASPVLPRERADGI
jgi:hypothetical protein